MRQEKNLCNSNEIEINFRVSKTVLSRNELMEILHGVQHHVIEQAKDDSPSRFLINRNIELYGETWGYRQKFSEGMQLEAFGTHEYIHPVYGIVCCQR